MSDNTPKKTQVKAPVKKHQLRQEPLEKTLDFLRAFARAYPAAPIVTN